LSDKDISYIDQLYLTHDNELIYRTYKYPQANRVKFHSKETPIDVYHDDADFLSIDNFFELLPKYIQDKFYQYFHVDFHDIAFGPKWRGTRLYLNKPNTKGVHIHKDIYSGGGTPRQVAINIPISANSLTSDLNFYDDTLELVHTVHYQARTPTVINTSVFHEVVHHDHAMIRKIVTISTPYNMQQFLNLLGHGRILA
jgi:hypothetical protein